MKFKVKIIIIAFLIFFNFGFVNITKAEENIKGSQKLELPIDIIEQIKKVLDINNEELKGILELDISLRKEKIIYYLKRKEARKIERQKELEEIENSRKIATSVLNEVNIKKINSRVARAKPHPNIYTQLEENRFRLAGTQKRDLSHWLSVLDKRDLDKDKYIVLPTQGLVVPINDVEETDANYGGFIDGREVDVASYLETGLLEFPSVYGNGYGEIGNKVIAGHSSYWKNKLGRYKTDFQQIIASDPGEEVWVYEKGREGRYKRYIYEIKKSYNTSADDVSVLKSTEKREITLFTCTPIGGIAGRWIVKAEFVKMD